MRKVLILKRVLKVLLGIFFVLAGLNHFFHPAFYVNIMPDYIPWHSELVFVSGVTEVLAGVLLFVPRFTIYAAWGIVAMLTVFLTVHIHMIVHADRYANVPLALLYLRVILQFPMIAWAWWFTRPEKTNLSAN